MSDLTDRVAALEAAVAQLVADRAPAPAASREPTDAEPTEDRFWVLTGLQRRHPAGAVVLAGHLTGTDGPIRWQWGVESDPLLDRDWSGGAAPLAALGHPVRLRLLQQVLAGRRTTAELAGDEELGTSGQLHHHLRTLVAAGWLQSTGRGRYVVPPPRVVPLLAIASATT